MWCLLEQEESWDLTFWRLRVRVNKHLVLVTEHIVVDVELVGDGPLKDMSRA